MNTKKELKTAGRGIVSLLTLAFLAAEYFILGMMAWMAGKSVYAFYKDDLHHGVQFGGIAVVLCVWAIFLELRTRKNKRTKVKVRFLPNAKVHLDGLEKMNFQPTPACRPTGGPNVKDNKGLPSTIQLMNRWMYWSRTTFKKSTVLSCVLHLRTEVEELHEAVNNRDDKNILKEGVDVILSTLSTLGRLGFTGGEIHNAMEDKFAINASRKWNLNSDNTYSHVKEAQLVTAQRVLDLYKSNFNEIGRTFNIADLVASVIERTTHAEKWTDNEVVELIENFLQDVTAHNMDKPVAPMFTVQRVKELFAKVYEPMPYAMDDLCQRLQSMWGGHTVDDATLLSCIAGYFVGDGPKPVVLFEPGNKVEFVGLGQQGTILSREGDRCEILWLNKPQSNTVVGNLKHIDHFTEEVKQ